MTYDADSMKQLNRVEPSYLAAYGLTKAPFSIEHDDRFFYSNSSLTEQLELLKHYTQYGNLLLIITGERGIGKSSLKQHFVATAQPEWQICEIQSHTMMDASILLKEVANGFGVHNAPHDPATLFEVLSEQLEHIHQSAHVPILVIDDAHELPQDALQALLYLAEHHSDQHATLRIILFCEPEIDVMLEDPAIRSLRERVTHSMDLAPLDEIQTAEYLRHRLAVAGLDGTSPFTPKLINKIFKASKGIPAQINEYAHQNLQDDREPVSVDDPELESELIHETSNLNLRNIILGTLGIAVVVSVLLFQDEINKLFEEPATIPADATVVENNETQQEQQKLSDSKNITNKEEKTPEETVKQQTIEISLNKKSDDTVENKNKVQTETAKPAIMLNSVNPNPVTASKQRQIISISGSGFNEQQKVKVSWKGNEKVLAETQVTFTSDTYLNLILNVGTNKDTWQVTVIDPESKTTSNTISFDVITAEQQIQTTSTKEAENKTETPKEVQTTVSTKETVKDTVKDRVTPAKTNGLYSQDWIQQQNQDHFTMQLLVSHQQESLSAYWKKYTLSDSAAWFKSKRNDKDTFTLVYGSYPTKEAAQTAATSLPKGMTKPWIRSFASILPSLSKTAPKVNESATKIIPAVKAKISNPQGWLWSQDPRHYTLQLAAGTDKKAIEAFIKRHNLKGKAVYFHRIRDGKDWYILVHGSYPGYSNAKSMIDQLPTALRKAKPWPRSFGAIHAELN